MEAENLTFTPFPRLPFEIRTMIWTLLLALPRHIDIRPSTRPSAPEDFQLVVQSNSGPLRKPPNMFAYRSKCPPPSLLHVNKEARMQALGHNQFDFGTQFTYRGSTWRTPPMIYINWNIDRVCIMDSTRIHTICPNGKCFEDLKLLLSSRNFRFLAINQGLSDLSPPGLKELVIFHLGYDHPMYSHRS
jgi:hypothetical protein